MTEILPKAIFSLCLADRPANPASIWSAWSFAPEVALPLLAFCFLYIFGYRRLAARNDTRRLSGFERGAFAIGALALAVALISPLCRMAATLAWAHMVQHALLVLVAPPLILLGKPGAALAAALPRLGPLGLPRSSGRPLPAALVYGLAIWAWHMPGLYQAALLGRGVHLLMYASLLASSLVFWRVIIMAARSQGQQTGAAAVILLVTIIHTGLLGALLTFSQTIWYPLVSTGAGDWGLSPIEDQQLAGLIMWVPMGVVYLAAALAIIGAWLKAMTPHSRSI